MAAAVVTSMAGDDRCVMMAAMVATGDGCCGGGVMVTAVMVSRRLRISRRGGVMVAPVMMSRRRIGGRRGDMVMAVVHPGLGRRRGQGHARQGERSGPTKSKGSGGPEGLVHVSLLPGRSLRPAAPGASE